jgi:hypothetical protein
MEILVRIFLPQRVESPLDCFSRDELLGWKLKLNYHKSYSYPDYEMDVVINERGFRDILHTYKRAPNSFRILGIGDSFLFGFGVNYNDNVLIQLQKLLNENDKSSQEVEVINSGVPAYNINQYYKILISECYKYKPDLVILFFYANDWVENARYEIKKVSSEGFLLSNEKFSYKSIKSFLLFPFEFF